MIARNRLTRIADRDGVDAKTVERDYVLTHVLIAIARQPDAKRMVFKGGTALRLCHLDDYRYSADLDFSLLDEMTASAARDVVAPALDEAAEEIGFPRLSLSTDGKRIDYVGPLQGKARSVKLDLAEDELVESTSIATVLNRYPDQPESEVLVYTLEEIAAEKVRCVIQRLQARDLSDLHELFVNNGVDADEIWPAFERKARHKGIDPTRFAVSFERRMPEWKARWEVEMQEHVPGALPKFTGLEREIRRALRAQLIRD